MKLLFSLLGICFFCSVTGQELNLDMEDVDAYGKPMVWRMGHALDQPVVYHMVADSVIKHNGRYSMKLTSNSNRANFASSFIVIPVPPGGKRVTLKGFVKTENVAMGTLFVSMMLDDTTVVLWDNLYVTDNVVKGTKDWTELTINLPIPEKVTMISFGSILNGTGTLWIDELRLWVDNVPITKSTVLQPYVKDPQTGKLRKF
ncbi:MAG: hypothetical protein ABI581_01480 [Sediminibacterium sp.]